MSPRQLPLALPHVPRLERSDFLAADANAAALAWIDRFPEAPGRVLALHGPPGSGKTHLAHIWAARVGAAFTRGVELAQLDIGAASLDGITALVVDGADRVAGDAAAERALFHLINMLRERGAALLLAGREPAARWAIALPDLASRLRAAQAVGVGVPDDALLAAVLVKLFAERQLAVGQDVVQYLVGRMERSLAAARALVGAIDREALAQRRRITIPLAAEALPKLQRELFSSGEE